MIITLLPLASNKAFAVEYRNVERIKYYYNGTTFEQAPATIPVVVTEGYKVFSGHISKVSFLWYQDNSIKVTYRGRIYYDPNTTINSFVTYGGYLKME